MGKKSRLKRRKYDLTKSEFMISICPQCRICMPNTQPSFCYDGCYVDDPKRFIKKVLPDLKEIRSALDSVAINNFEMQADDEFEFMLEEVFCDANICGHGGVGAGCNCVHKLGCLHELRSQIKDIVGRTTNIGSNRGRKSRKGNKNNYRKQKKQKYVPPTPFFFCNDNFRPEVERIVNGINTEQQDKGKEPTRSATADAGRRVEGSES
jgi:hypothetical protein